MNMVAKQKRTQQGQAEQNTARPSRTNTATQSRIERKKAMQNGTQERKAERNAARQSRTLTLVYEVIRLWESSFPEQK